MTTHLPTASLLAGSAAWPGQGGSGFLPQLLPCDGFAEGKRNSIFPGVCWVFLLLSSPSLGLVASLAAPEGLVPWDLPFLLGKEQTLSLGMGFINLSFPSRCIPSHLRVLGRRAAGVTCSGGRGDPQTAPSLGFTGVNLQEPDN